MRGPNLRLALLFVAWEFARVIEHAAKALLALKRVNGGYFLRGEFQLGGGWNIGLVFGLAQFLTTFIITWIYVKFANKNIEPKSAAIREELEGI